MSSINQNVPQISLIYKCVSGSRITGSQFFPGLQSSTPPFQIPSAWTALPLYPLQTPPPGAAPTPTPLTSTIMCRREFQIPVHSCHVCLIGFVLAYARLGAANYNEQNIPTSISNYNLDT